MKMKAVKSILNPTNNNNKIMWDDEELVENHNPRLNGKKMERNVLSKTGKRSGPSM